MVEKCCYCIELKIGCILIAAFGLIKGLVLLLAATQEYEGIDLLPPWMHGLFLIWEVGKTLLIFVGLHVGVSSLMLLIALLRDRSGLTKYWLCMMTIYVSFNFAIGIYTAIKTQRFYLIIGPIVVAGFEGYCTLVLWSWDMENS
ncbi:uncharacterized protein isoform X3 [Choristoneura fumiferana]|uniref:uncharacterized protein isoform X2 n=1 Tax=Choristoneura fumiferana TaxID=7141 RepID=UPI003D15DEAA